MGQEGGGREAFCLGGVGNRYEEAASSACWPPSPPWLLAPFARLGDRGVGASLPFEAAVLREARSPPPLTWEPGLMVASRAGTHGQRGGHDRALGEPEASDLSPRLMHHVASETCRGHPWGWGLLPLRGCAVENAFSFV